MPRQPERDLEPLGPAHQPLVTLAVAFGLGIVVDRYAPVRAEIWWLTAAATLVVWCGVWRLRWIRTAAVLLLLATAGLGAARHHLHWSVFPIDDLGRAADETSRPIVLEAVALENPRRRPAPSATPLAVFQRGDQSELDVQVVAVRDGLAWRPMSGKAELAVEGHLLGVRAGDRLRIDAMYQRPQPPLNPGEFDFAARDRADRKLCRLWADHPDAVTLRQQGSSLRPRRLLGSIRDRGEVSLWRYVAPERAGLAAALVLGSREQLDRERLEPFFLTGMMHVLAISGMHLGILIGGVWLLLRTGLMQRRTAIWSAMLLAVFYAFLTGGQPPVVRAAILVVVLCIGRLAGKPAFAFNTLAAAALVVLAANPAELFNTGAQLSFLAFGVLVWIGPRVAAWRRLPEDPLDRLIAQTRPWPRRAARALATRVAQVVATSLAVWLAVLPLAMYRFHVVPPAAILLNLVLWIPVTAALFSGFGVVLLGELFPPLATLCGAVCDGSLAMLENVILHTQQMIDLHFWTPGPALWWVIGTYIALAACAAFPQWRPSRRWLAAAATVWLALGLAPPDSGFRRPASFAGESRLLHAAAATILPTTKAPEQVNCTFIAVGHGVSVLLEFPDGRTLLYDAGSLGPPTSGGRAIAAVLWSRGLRHLDAVVLSHADADHYNALPELLERFSVGVVYVSPLMFDHQTPG
ncbi:MAG: ComEC/Rec2 family competence protein, partial [Planctomycetes bacterium]|nr:ComEC/Rec2 family competence protein [Planctomycetota bacterium]